MSLIFEKGQSIKERCLEEWQFHDRPKKEVFAFEDGFNKCHSELVIPMICGIEKSLKELKYFRNSEGPFGCISGSFLDDAIEALERFAVNDTN